MDRREFFRSGFRKASDAAVSATEAHVNQRAAHWIRPPFALDELDFLIACSRCGACTEACPHQVIFPLSARLGASVAATPALDVLNKGCRMCADWPCVAACEPGALKFPDAGEEAQTPESAQLSPASLPKMARAQVNTVTCLPYQGPECGVCSDSCPVPGALVFDLTRPHIEPALCTGCGLCREVCITTPNSIELFSPHASQRTTPD